MVTSPVLKWPCQQDANPPTVARMAPSILSTRALGALLDAGAEEVNDNGDTWEIVSEATDFVAVRTALQDAARLPAAQPPRPHPMTTRPISKPRARRCSIT